MKFTATEEKIEELFNDNPNDPVDQELYKWFMFAVTGKGRGIKDMDTLNFQLFKDRLQILVETVYQWQKEIS